MPTSCRRPSSGFTLIELLTVIAIIGVLAAVIFPTVSKVRETAQRSVDGSNLREILKAATIYAADNNDRLPDPQNIAAATLTAGSRVFLWPGILAKNGILTDPSFYFCKNDPLYNGTVPNAIISTTSTARNSLDSTFTSGRILSWEFVGGVKMNNVPTTPVAYTRGLQSGGTWNINSGVYKDTGGFIAFLGGNVNFYNTIANVLTTNSGSGRRVTDIRQAIPYNTSNAALSAYIYGTPTPAGPILGTAAGQRASNGPR